MMQVSTDNAVIQLRGTSGSGKTTAMKHMLELTRAEPLVYSTTRSRNPAHQKVLVYKGRLDGARVYVLGDYSPHRNAGGCDTIPKIQEVIDLAKIYGTRRRSVLLLEGLLLAHSWGAFGEFAHEAFGERYINAFLDTPVEKCLRRVVKRRAARGQETEGARAEKIEKNVYADFHRVELCYDRVVNRGGVRVDIAHRDAKAELENLVRETIRKYIVNE